MGITGLIPFLSKATEKTNLNRLPRGSTAAVDTYSWLHKGAFSCADVLARGETTEIHIKYCLKYVQLLLSHGIRPILVFDGRHLPAKELTEKKRRENRQASKQRAAELMRLGRHDEARTHLRRCVDITHAMALQLIRHCRKLAVDCIVAPFEADGQLAYLNRCGLADYVITEDSDLVLFGCQRILFKLDLSGDCVLLDARRLPEAIGCRPLERYSIERLRFMCILSGCDYVDSLAGIGLVKACKFVLMTDGELRDSLHKLPAYLNMRQLSVSDAYRKDVLRANATFQHMIVYDPQRRRLVRLSDPLELGVDEPYIDNAGEFFDEQLAFQLAVGNVDPMTLQQMDDWSPDDVPKARIKNGKTTASIWHLRNADSNVSSNHKDGDGEHMRRCIAFRTSPKRMPNIVSSRLTDDLLDAYSNVAGLSNEPSMIGKHAQLHAAPDNEFNLSRNPFVIAVRTPIKMSTPEQQIKDAEDQLRSPTKLCAANSSLLRQCSPMKRIDYVDMTATATTSTSVSKSPHKMRSCKARFGSSKSMRTHIDAKQNVLSRFFSSKPNRDRNDDNTASVAAASTDSIDLTDTSNDAQALAARLDAFTELFERNERTAAIFYTKISTTTATNTTPDTKRSRDLSGINSPATFNAKMVLTPPAKKTCRTLSFATDDGGGDSRTAAKTQPATKTLTTTKTCRQPGQRGKSTKTPTSIHNGTQSRLSSFGFKKKSI